MLGRFSALGSARIILVLVVVVLAIVPAAMGRSPSGSASDSSAFEKLAADAASARDAGKPEEAVRNYRAAVALRPDWEEGWWYLGTLLYDGDHYEEAIPALQRMVELDANAGAAWAFLGLCEFETGDYPDSYTHLQSAKTLGFAQSPDVEKVALYHLALLLNVHSEFESATELLVGTFGDRHYPEQIKKALALALLRAPVLPAQVDPSKDALIQAAGEAAVLLANRDTDAALVAFERMIHDFPGTPYLHYRYGSALRSAKRYPAAEAEFRAETQATPRSPLAWSALAEVLRAQGKNDEQPARQARELAQAPQDAGSQAARYALNRAGANATVSPSGDGTETSTTPSGTSPDAGFEEAVRRAQEARSAGRAEEAVAWYQAAAKLRSSWPEGWRQLGTIQYMSGRYPDAVAALSQSVALETKQADTWTLLGLSEFETKDYKNALVHLERGRALGFSGNAAAVRLSRYHLALLQIHTGEFDRAIDVLIPAIGAGPLADEIRFAMGMALLRIPVFPEEVKPEQRDLVQKLGEAGELLADSRYDRALPMFQAIVNDYPTTPFVHYAYGDALAATSMFDEAELQLRAEVKSNPASALPFLRLASIELQEHRSASALEDARKAAAISSDSSEAHYLLGRSHLEEGEIPAAIQELETARRLSPTSSKVHFNLARAYSRAGRPAEAQQERAEFERLSAQSPAQRRSYGDTPAADRPERQADAQAAPQSLPNK